MEKLNEQLLKRLKSLLWRSTMMGLAVFISYFVEHLGELQLSPVVIGVLGLILGEVSKFINNQIQSKNNK